MKVIRNKSRTWERTGISANSVLKSFQRKFAEFA